MLRTALLLAAGAATAAATLQTCANAQYDPNHYVCYGGSVLCPVLAGEKYKQCGQACYSSFQYSCKGSALSQLPELPGSFTLTAWNPTEPELDGLPITACDFQLRVGGTTCSYCPSVVPAAECPSGTTTVLFAGSLDVEVPGGQQIFLTAEGFLSYTEAHSGYIPTGSIVGGLVAYQGGGLININEGALGWKACRSTASSPGGSCWTLVSYNAANEHLYTECPAVELKVHPCAGNTVGAWQYT